MKLWEVPRGTWVRSVEPDGSDFKFKLLNIDGAYSRCETEGGQVYHIAAWLEVEPLEEKK